MKYIISISYRDIGMVLLSIIIQIAIGRSYPFTIMEWQWWVFILPISIIIQRMLIYLLK